ncbi:MAG TPA: lysylphosphatidylglycerol synthase transmembrane domain-containing protein [Patescibacteria group bacterium]|nr:lysylphosphatidylglycerol synthase transmembrane domain-containing protein [Patescibacteria group bacterium]
MRKFRWLTLAAGLGLLGWLVVRSGPRRLAVDLLHVGWWMTALLAIAALRNGLRAMAVRLALGEDRGKISLGAMYVLVMVSEAVQFVAVAGILFGQTTKGWLLARHVSGPRAVSTVMVDVLLYYLTTALFALGGIGLFFALYPALRAVREAGLVGAAVFGGAILAGAVAFRRRWLRASRLVGPLARWGLVRRRETVERSAEIDEQMFAFHNRHPRAFRGILALDFGSQFLSALEVMVILWLLGLGASYRAAIVVEGFTKLVGIGGLVVPGDVGLYQGGTGLIFRAMGYTLAAGVATGIIRQLRSILWAGIGFLALLAPGYAQTK